MTQAKKSKKSLIKAFIFDLDGVLIDGEPLWESKKQQIYRDLLGKTAATNIGYTVGMSMDDIYQKLSKLNPDLKKSKFYEIFQSSGDYVYRNAPLTESLADLENFLLANSYKIGIVSSSPEKWIRLVIKRLSFKKDIKVVVSLHDNNELKSKPFPDGYQKALLLLGSQPGNTIALEDSNQGIKSARSAGLFTIGFRMNLLKGYKQSGADEYADRIEDIIKIINKWEHKHGFGVSA